MNTKSALGLTLLMGLLSFNSFAAHEILGGKISCPLGKQSENKDWKGISCDTRDENGKCTIFMDVYTTKSSCDTGACNWIVKEGRILGSSEEIQEKMPIEFFQNASESFNLKSSVNHLEETEDTASNSVCLPGAVVADTVTYPFRVLRERVRRNSQDRRIRRMVTQEKYNRYIELVDFMANPDKTGEEIALSWDDCVELNELIMFSSFIAKKDQQ